MLQPSPRAIGNAAALESTACSSLLPVYGTTPGTAQSLVLEKAGRASAADHVQVMRELESALLSDGTFPDSQLAPMRPAALAAENAKRALEEAMRGSGSDFYPSTREAHVALAEGVPARTLPGNFSPRRLEPFASTKSPSRANAHVGPRFDVLTLRGWFNEMDSDRSGHVTKVKWLDFLRANPRIKHIILAGSGSEDTTAMTMSLLQDDSAKRTQIRQLRFLQKIWRDIDSDHNGTLEWEEFLEFFRKLGFLFKYVDPDNPKEKLAEILKDLHENAEPVSAARYSEFQHLKGKHLHAGKRRFLEEAALGSSWGFATASP